MAALALTPRITVARWLMIADPSALGSLGQVRFTPFLLNRSPEGPPAYGPIYVDFLLERHCNRCIMVPHTAFISIVGDSEDVEII